MRAPISIIVPTRDAAGALPSCLGALTDGLEIGLIRELIVSDAGSRDDTGALAREWGAEIVTGGVTRAERVRRGGKAAKGDWLLIVDPGAVLETGWTRPVMEHIRGERSAWLPIRFQRGGLIRAGLINLAGRLGRLSARHPLLVRRDRADDPGRAQVLDIAAVFRS